MKIAVLNFSGNVGKSTISKHLLSPRLNDAPIISVETINSDESDSDNVKGKQFGLIQDTLMTLDDAVLDIGSSNVEVFIQLMKQYRGSHEDYDYFLIPTTSNFKQQRDTISTIDTLNSMGIPAKKIRVVFNMVEMDETIESLFYGLLEYHASSKSFELRIDAVIHQNEIYGRLKESGKTISEILEDKTDYKAKLKTTTDKEEKINLAKIIGLKRLALGVSEDLDAVFKTLFK
jgi:Flp pilus assembly CpaE family ATPase